MPDPRKIAPLAGAGVASAFVARGVGPWVGVMASAALYATDERSYAGAVLAGTLLGALLAPAPAEAHGPVVPGGTVLSPYGRRSTGNGSSQFHLGIDIRAPEGTPIYAAHSGVVKGAYDDGELGGYGNTVVIDHESEPTAALYAHMDSIAPGITRGAHVQAGDLVGTVGHTNSAGGFASSPDHLHLEILVATDGDPQRSFTHFYGGPNWYPDRVDPQVWAAEHGVALVG